MYLQIKICFIKSHILWLLRQNIRNFDFLLIIDSYTRFAKSLNYKKTMVYLGKLTVSFMYKEWIRGDTHMKCQGLGVGNYSGRLNSPYDQTRHHTEPNVNILLARNIFFDPDVRQWSHPSMIPMHCLWAKANNRTCGQFECDMTWFCFCFDFVHSQIQCVCCSMVCLLFQVLQIKQVNCKMSTKNKKNYE